MGVGLRLRLVVGVAAGEENGFGSENGETTEVEDDDAMVVLGVTLRSEGGKKGGRWLGEGTTVDFFILPGIL